MRANLYRVRDVGNGFLAVMAAPGSNRLEKTIRSLKRQGVDVVVSLLEIYEAEMIGLHRERRLCDKHGIEFISFPIIDHDVPRNIAETRRLLERTTRRLRAGQGVAIHCFGGIGRTGVVAAGQLIMLGDEPGTAFEVLSEARGSRMPATRKQLQWVHEHRDLFDSHRTPLTPDGKPLVLRKR